MPYSRTHCTCTFLFALVTGFLAISWGPIEVARAQDAELRTDWQQFQSELVDVIAEAERSVVSIALIRDATASGPLIDPFEFDDGNAPETPGFVPHEFGSGVIISRNGFPEERFVLTNYHVVHGSRQSNALVAPVRLAVRLPSRHVVWANELAGDPRSDLSVLALDLAAAGLTAEDVHAFELEDAPPPRKGQFVVALGNPYAIARDGSASVSIGVISNIARRTNASPARTGDRQDTMIHEYGTLLTVDTRLQFGGSGGALVDFEGRLIGLTTSLAALEGYEASAGYAIPLDAGFQRVVESLVAGYEVEYGFLGVALRDVLQDETIAWDSVRQPTAASADLVAADSPAHRGGLRAGDVILAVNDNTVYGADDLTQTVGLLGPEAVATLTVYRPTSAQQLTLEVRLGKWPVHDDASIVATSRRWPLWRGLGIDYSTARRRYLPFDVLLTYRKTVLVSEVAAGSAAEQAGLKVGDMIAMVDEAAVETPHEFHQAVANRTEPVTLVLLDGRRVSLSDTVDRSE